MTRKKSSSSGGVGAGKKAALRMRYRDGQLVAASGGKKIRMIDNRKIK